MSDRLELLRELVTPAIRKMAVERLSIGAEKGALVKRGQNKALIGAARTAAKFALLYVHAINPFEHFTVEEKALIHGVSSDTVSRNGGAGMVAKLRP